MEKVEIRELVEEALENIIEKKKVDLGLIKLEIRTDGDSMWAVGSRSKLYNDILDDLVGIGKEEIEDKLKKVQDEFIELQELIINYIEQE